MERGTGKRVRRVDGGEGSGEENGKGRRREGNKEGKRKKNIYKIAFWNVAGLGNKDKEFWQGLKEWDVRRGWIGRDGKR